MDNPVPYDDAVASASGPSPSAPESDGGNELDGGIASDGSQRSKHSTHSGSSKKSKAPDRSGSSADSEADSGPDSGISDNTPAHTGWACCRCFAVNATDHLGIC
ncbi:hypothetical protein N656DRAFT_782247 [Canariomyces notabilis]|uniref:Uncharacterized protein n=1 Tax=Canariomyces notabilis TaxID=2074819 RepID=A0AAN6TAD5_9PEZI|nr:hypothetical protein N656DRAFT_782247 [Canariomyces arenarius]